MHGERQRDALAGRSPRRAIDRLEDLVLSVLIALGMLTAVVAATVRARVHCAMTHRVDVETRERAQVQAVLLEAAAAPPDADERGHGVSYLAGSVPVRHLAPDGTERQAQAQVVGPLSAEAAVPVRVDRTGAITTAPARAIEALGEAAREASSVLGVGLLALAGVRHGVRAGLLRLNTGRWAREWARVEPRWAGHEG